MMTTDRSDARATNAYWGRDGLERKILDALGAAGKNVDALTIDDLAPADQFHGGGKGATERLARLAGFRPDTRVLDVGGGLGGPARTLAVQFGCRVTLVDLTESYVRAGGALTARLGLTDRVTHRVGDALTLDVGGETFDVVWTQNSGMNIADKERLYAGFARVLRPGGRLVLQEPMAGPVQPMVYPVMWARDPSTSFLRTPDAMRAVIENAGFRVRAWDDVSGEIAGPGSAAAIPAHSVQRIIMGETLDAITRSGQRNREEKRIVMIQAVLERRATPA
jgi:ubiquinone/menaquinone biosynthesis C-methylase UbiE